MYSIDGNMSYAETLRKVVQYLNDTTGQVSTLTDAMTYLQNEGLEESVVNNLNTKINDGTISNIINNTLLTNINNTLASVITNTDIRNRMSQPRRKRYIFFDSFARISDSTTSLGNCETNETPYTILGQNNPVWGIQGGQAYIVTTNPFTQNALAYQETNESNGILEATINGLGTTTGLAFRIKDANNFWSFVVGSGLCQLTKWVDGVATSTPLVNITGSILNSKIAVSFNGNKIEGYVDGYLKSSTVDSFNVNETKHGMHSRGTSSAGGYRWKNLNMRPVGEVYNGLTEDFESGSLKWYWKTESANQPYSITWSSTFFKSGTKSIRFELNKTDPDSTVGSKRSEITLPSEGALEEHWYGVSIYLPKGGIEDYAYDEEKEIIAQWHTTPDNGEENVSPPLALFTWKNDYYIGIRYGSQRMSTQSGLPGFDTKIGSYVDDKGKWVDWVFHVKWGYLSEHDPVTEVYKNGQLVFSYIGKPNCMNDQRGVYPKLGIYKWPWAGANASIITKRVVYYDDYWIK